ncbi:MAG: hypothetical protein U5L10_03150 [Candidatus Moranbacteria bacterium]|nr:hypothetical protein [Candidatus Moranbacteria bacterium]
MGSYHKTGNRKGRPAYRTPSSFIARQKVEVQTQKAKKAKDKTTNAFNKRKNKRSNH